MNKPQNQFKLYPYSANYPEKFAKYQKEIIGTLNGHEIEIHHIGSTAVLGLGGKGFIDILIGLPDWSQEDEIVEKLKELGFTHIHPKEDERIFLSKNPKDTKNYDAHLHVTLKDSEQYNKMLNFRNCLRNNPQKVKEYYDLKLELFKSTGADRKKYARQKAKFVEETLAIAQ